MTTQQNQIQLQTQEKQKNKNHGVLGIIAGVAVGTLLQPLEIIKIGLIIGPANNQQLKDSLHKGNMLTHTKNIIKHIYQTEGIKGFFRSYIPSIFRNGGGSGTYFFTLNMLEDYAKKYYVNGDPNKQKQASFINSAIARMTSTVVINPFSVVGSRIEVPGFNEYSNMKDGFKQIYHKEGIKAFFRGNLASCLKDGPFAGLYLVIYKHVKDIIQRQNYIQLHFTATSMISGIVAGLMATMTSHPLEIIRARLQITQSQTNQKHGIIKMFKQIYVEDGIPGYFRGITPRLVKKPIANSLTFAAFETFHYLMHDEKWGH